MIWLYLTLFYLLSALPRQIPRTAMLHFILMDYDFMMSNDYGGEAFLRLDEISGLSPHQQPNDVHAGSLRQFALALIHSEPKGK